jgi:hypothetical protein
VRVIGDLRTDGTRVQALAREVQETDSIELAYIIVHVGRPRCSNGSSTVGTVLYLVQDGSKRAKPKHVCTGTGTYYF